jgi:hypothetical protein
VTLIDEPAAFAARAGHRGAEQPSATGRAEAPAHDAVAVAMRGMSNPPLRRSESVYVAVIVSAFRTESIPSAAAVFRGRR